MTFVVLGDDYRVKIPMRLKGAYRYTTGGLLAERLFKRYPLSGGTPEERTMVQFTYDLSPVSPAVSDFTLTAFGLPEPYGVTWDRPTPWWLYALISAGALLVVAVVVILRKRSVSSAMPETN
ncbi:MAG TPA: hypothetical protein PKD86_07345 [Gemmatales bacterium]|nr:hypothetical protein [Gemmatales bacterium]